MLFNYKQSDNYLDNEVEAAEEFTFNFSTVDQWSMLTFFDDHLCPFTKECAAASSITITWSVEEKPQTLLMST